VPATDHDPPASHTMTGILHHSPRPVLVAAERVPEADSVVVAYDGSVQAARAVASFVSSGIRAGYRITVLGVGDDVTETTAKVDRAVAYLEAHGRSPQVRILSATRGVAPALLDAVGHASPALLVMGAYGKPRIKEVLFGSVTRAMIARVPVPLFL